MKDDSDPFADLDKLQLKPELVEAWGKAAGTKQTGKRQRSVKPFTKFPHSWEERLREAKRISTYRVALHLLYLHWKSGGAPLPLSNVALTGKGVSRRSKWNALVELRQLGLIRIESRGRKVPLIHVLVE